MIPNKRHPTTFLRLPLGLLFLLFSLHLFSQNIRFERIPNELGLSQNLISSLLQDRQGFIWAGTKDGLNRFDGYRFRVFQHDPFDSTTISDNNIKCILEDSRGWLWIGASNGLNLMDRKTETFQRLYPKGNITGPAPAIIENYTGLSGSDVYSLLEDREGNIWVGAVQGGVIKLEIPAGNQKLEHPKFTVFRATEDENSLWKNPIKKMAEDEEGVIWVHTRNQICLIRKDKESGAYEIERLHWDDVDPQWPRYRQEDFKYTDLGETQVDRRFYSIFSDRAGAVWLTMAGGFAKWRPARKDFVLYPLDVNLADYPILPLTGAEGVDGFIDQRGRIWIDGLQTLVVYDTLTHKIVAQFHREAAGTPGFFKAGFHAMMEDVNGNIWIGTNGNGLYQNFPHKKRFSEQQDAMLWEGESLRAICQASDGTIWMGTASRKLLHMDWQTQKTETIILDQAKWPRAFDSEIDQVFAMEEDREGNLWVAASRGLFRFRPQGGKLADWKFFKIYEGEDFFPNVFDVHIDGEGVIWLLTHFEFGRFDPKTGRFDGHDYLRISGGQKEIGSNFPCIFQQKNGLFWLGTKQGLLRFDAGSSRFSFFTTDPKNPSSLSHPLVRCIQADPAEPERVLWVGTGGGGLNRFDTQTGRFTHFKKSDGLPDNVVYAILDDEAGNLWMSTNQGLSRFNPATGIFKNYGVEDGLQDNEFNSGAYFKSRDGRLFFGGIGGFNAFLPEVVKDDTFQPPIVLTDFKLANKPVDVKSEGSPLKTDISQTKELVLTWRDNIFSFEFAALDYTEPGRNQYAYKLENFDEDWQYIGTQRTATFTNLDPGEYIFRVKGANHDGTWNEAGASLKITILPPWWKTWWAWLSYALLFGAAVYWFYKFQLNRKLEQAEAEKIKEMDRLKTRLYTNITHEFRTPLTVILGMTEAQTDIPRAMQLIRRNGEKLLNLINQILDLSRLDNNSLQPRYQQIEMVSYTQYIGESFQSLAEKKQIHLDVRCEIRQLWMDMDEEIYRQIISNLLSNAIKFTPENGTISLRLAQKDDCLTLHIQDNGIGIPDDALPHIFDRFYQVDNAESSQGKGTGIGLALVRELVGLLDGQIEIASEVNRGTLFTVQLPVRLHTGKKTEAFPPVVIDRTVAEPFAVAPAAGDAELPNLLIIEDNPDVVFYIQSILLHSYSIQVAPNGAAGIKKAIETIPDIIISDVMMPEKNGFEVVEALKQDQRTSHIPIILLTARAAREDRIEGLQSGADAYLMKPFDKAELFIRLEKLVELRKALQARYARAAHPVVFPQKGGQAAPPSLDDLFLQNIRRIIDEKIGDADLDIPYLCKKAGLSSTQLFRKMKALTGEAPISFIRKVRLHKAKELLQTTDLTISEIAYDLGFNDPNYFSRAFSKEFGISPSDVRK